MPVAQAREGKTMKKRYSTVVFDLDGTLLNTLEDLTNAVNAALRESGFPERTMPQVRTFVGNGVGMLMRRALPAGFECDEEAYAEVLQAFKSHYSRHNNDTTQPYPGVMDMLRTLHKAGVRMAIVSNKNDPNVQALTQLHFAGLMDLAVGEREGMRRKPHPDALNQALQTLGETPEHALYVGDSGVDVWTARNAGVRCASVCWGFHSAQELRREGADTLIQTPADLVALVLGEDSPTP